MISPLRLIAVAVAASVLVIMIMTVLVPIIGDDSDAWRYDDYREIIELHKRVYGEVVRDYTKLSEIR